ncbi:VWA-like domain-containing protein [Streptomyces sp. NPDC006332]|uniref:vWA domain-containing protein n=1 Tax=Streptomyces sp. NPDC006332 TaxID=3155456 RepID=UPI0033B9B522
MLTQIANGNPRLSLWLRVREFAVPPSMIATATARRRAGDWAGACAAAGVDVDVDVSLRSVARAHGHDLAGRVRADLRRLAPDLLRWHMPRIAPDGMLRPGLTLSLARYDAVGRTGSGSVHLVARTPPAWADAGQRISLTLWDGSRTEGGACRHPHPRPNRRFRLDLHRHLWDASRSDELRLRSGADQLPGDLAAAPGTADGGLPSSVPARTGDAGPGLAGLRERRRRAGPGVDRGPDGAHGLSAQEQDAVRFRVAQGISGRPGDAPRGWQRWAEEAFHPPQPWRDLLGAAVRAAASGTGAGEDYTYGRPSRRSASMPGVVLPSLRRRPPQVSVVIDTSGSVSDVELGSALLEVAAIARAVGGRRDLVTVVPCDAAARIVHPLCRGEGIPLLGGGGTDLRTGFAKALRARPTPDVVVVLTDGQTPWPATRPPCRTVVGLFPRHHRSWDEDDPDYEPDTPPDWARVVDIGSAPAGR